jgi:hypothetical protein
MHQLVMGDERDMEVGNQDIHYRDKFRRRAGGKST